MAIGSPSYLPAMTTHSQTDSSHMSSPGVRSRPTLGTVSRAESRRLKETLERPGLGQERCSRDRQHILISDHPHDMSGTLVTGTDIRSFHSVSSHHPCLRELDSQFGDTRSTLSSPRLAAIAQASVVVVHCTGTMQLSLLHGLRRFLPVSTPIIALCNPNSARGVSILAGGADFVYRPPVAIQTIEATRIAHNRRVETASAASKVLERERRPSSMPRTGDSPESPDIGPIAFDIETHTIEIRGDRASMSRRPFMLLHYLASHRGDCCTRTEILEEVWDLEFDPGTNIVDVQIYKVRKLLESYNLRNMVQTVRGRGYRLAWPLQ